MARSPDVSIATISYNQGKYLRQCVESILGQKSISIEYIVVDAGSTDGSIEYLKSQESRIDQLIVEPDEGPADGLNKAFRMASAPVLMYLNADDFLLPNILHEFVREFTRRSVDCLIGDAWIVDHEGRPLRRFASSRFWPWIAAAGNCSVAQQATLIRRTSFEAVGGFNPKNRLCWDTELLFDLSASGYLFGYSRTIVGAFRLHPSGLTGSGMHESEVLDYLYDELGHRVGLPSGPYVRKVARAGARFVRLGANPRVLGHRLWAGALTASSGNERSLRRLLGLGPIEERRT